ncbi:MAG: Rpn family recombination-promoting nuclease/putative transposase [Chloroherpetonaceae bacterium]|nr:Rpn family recombination-promoting nuclease/putative transposase [Chloroherpetonaceae bacterium]
MKAIYINPFTDFGFKKIFGEEASKPLLMDFLNALLAPKKKIVDLTFKNAEQLGITDIERKAVYDIYCENEDGEKFIVELQKAKQNYFKDRTVYYSTFPIREQAEKGTWNYNLKAVYCIGILDFTFDDYESEAEKSQVLHTILLKNQNGKVFYDKLTFIYLEMPNFNKNEDELTSRLDQWLYFIKHLEDFTEIPKIFKDSIFLQAFEKAEIAKFNSPELDRYESSLKQYRDLKGVNDTAFHEGKLEGKLEGLLETARTMIKEGESLERVKKYTGISIED